MPRAEYRKRRQLGVRPARRIAVISTVEGDRESHPHPLLDGCRHHRGGFKKLRPGSGPPCDQVPLSSSMQPRGRTRFPAAAGRADQGEADRRSRRTDPADRPDRDRDHQTRWDQGRLQCADPASFSVDLGLPFGPPPPSAGGLIPGPGARRLRVQGARPLGAESSAHSSSETTFETLRWLPLAISSSGFSSSSFAIGLFNQTGICSGSITRSRRSTIDESSATRCARLPVGTLVNAPKREQYSVRPRSPWRCHRL